MAFNLLPLEINENIASCLDTDKEVRDFGLVCHATHSAVNSHRGALWRDRFARRYDLPEGQTGSEIKTKYILRARRLRSGGDFVQGQEYVEIRTLEMLRDLVVESYAGVALGCKAEKQSKNIRELRHFVQRSNILDRVFSSLDVDRNFSNLLRTLQLVLSYLQFDLSMATPPLGFQDSQCAVYSHPRKVPLIGDVIFNVNTQFLMHLVNFFRQHLTQASEHTLYELFRELGDHEKPRAWDSKLYNGPGVKKLGRYWKGTFAYLHDLDDVTLIRNWNGDSDVFFTDSLPDIQDGFQTLELDDSPAANPVSWPKAFESHLHGIPPLPLCRILDMLQEPDGDLRDYGFGSRRLRGLRPREPQTPPGSPGLNRVNIAYPAPPPTPPSTPPCAKPKRNVHYRQFSGSGRDFDDFHCSGIVHPLPPQEGIPGFQRITMMKFKDPLTNLPSQSPSAFSSTDGILSPNSPLSSSVSSNSSHTNGDRPYPTDPFRPEQMENDHFQLEDDADVDDECWCYEGVVLPGGMMMLGRWWSPTNNDSNMTNMGPFIFWNVEDE